MATCKLCGKSATLVKSHIIPESFFREVMDDSGTPLMISSSASQPFPKRAPIGVYDQELLCAGCEEKFSDLDDYAAKVLIRQYDDLFEPLMRGSETVGFASREIDQQRLWRFMVSVLWRASASSQPFYRSISLGPHQEAAAEAIFNADASPVTHRQIGVTLSRWVATPGREKLTTAVMSPFRERYDAINSYRVYFGRTVAYCRVDNRRPGDPMKSMELGAGPVCHVVAREFDASKDLGALVNVSKIAASRYAAMKANYGVSCQ